MNSKEIVEWANSRLLVSQGMGLLMDMGVFTYDNLEFRYHIWIERDNRRWDDHSGMLTGGDVVQLIADALKVSRLEAAKVAFQEPLEQVMPILNHLGIKLIGTSRGLIDCPARHLHPENDRPAECWVYSYNACPHLLCTQSTCRDYLDDSEAELANLLLAAISDRQRREGRAS